MTQIVQDHRPASANAVRFSVAAHSAWAPGRESPTAWQAWAENRTENETTDEAIRAEPALPGMPPLLRRRASTSGKMALHAAYAIAAAGTTGGIPAIFCSRHGECTRSAELLTDLARQLPLSPTAFSLSVHNATGGLFSIARGDRSNNLALAAGAGTIEHAVIEACGLLADGAPAVLLAAADGPLPSMYADFADCEEQPFGWAWLLQAAKDKDDDAISLQWTGCQDDERIDAAMPHGGEPGGLQVMRFFLRGDRKLQRIAERRRWTWSRDA